MHGLSTKASDVSRDYSWNAGFRYDPDDGEASWRVGFQAKTISTRITRYPFSSDPQRGEPVDEMRLEANVSWSPTDMEEFTFSANWQHYEPEDNSSSDEQDYWASIS